METLIKQIRCEFIRTFSLLNKPHQFFIEELKIRLRKLHNLLRQLDELEFELNKRQEIDNALMFIDSILDQLDYAVPETIIPFAKEQLKMALFRFNLYYV